MFYCANICCCDTTRLTEFENSHKDLVGCVWTELWLDQSETNQNVILFWAKHGVAADNIMNSNYINSTTFCGYYFDPADIWCTDTPRPDLFKNTSGFSISSLKMELWAHQSGTNQNVILFWAKYGVAADNIMNSNYINSTTFCGYYFDPADIWCTDTPRPDLFKNTSGFSISSLKMELWAHRSETNQNVILWWVMTE